MMMKNAFLLFAVIFFSSLVVAQNVTLSGSIKNRDQQPVSNATIQVMNVGKGISSNDKGNFSLSLPKGKYQIQISHIGLETIRQEIVLTKDLVFDFVMIPAMVTIGEGFAVEATRATVNTPVTHQEITAAEIEDINLAQDLPILLNQTVSAVTTSDAGAGVGYTGIRIRGSDATRINVTVNGVPLNDPEGHGVFWVNMPDFASSTNSIQIQRGVGTSTNGSAAFGASINLQTTAFQKEASAEINNSFGSFNTRKHNVILNSGLINDHFNFEGRLSYIGSDGYIDRSGSNLRSYYLAGGYYGEKLMVKAVSFSGKEVTHQAWWGTPQSRVEGDVSAMETHAINNGYTEQQTENLLNSGRTYNYYEYDNEIDDYQQDHYQLITGYQFNDHLKLNLTGHYTYGRGYFEQYKEGESFGDIGFADPIIGSDTISSSNMILQRWLDNHFYGGVYSFQYQKGKLNATLGGSYNEYVGEHHGEVIWSEYAVNTNIRERYYFSDSKKTDLSQYLKAEYSWEKLTLYADLQLRAIDYRAKGIDNDQRIIDVDQNYLFFNPKVGASYRPNKNNRFYFTVAQASREPVRSDFIDAEPGVIPKPEFMTNAELGWSFAAKKWSVSTNAFLMNYKDQLVLTGALNDVGSSLRTNVAESYRAGIEIAAEVRPYKGLFWKPNATFSQNKIANFNEVLYDYTIDFDVVEVNHGTTDIAFSPNVIIGSTLGYETNFGLTLAFFSKFVGKQYLDNTSSEDRILESYFVNDVSISYDAPIKGVKRLTFSLLVNNVLNEMYSSNGYTYSYYYGDLITENFYYPQAGTNWLLGMKWKF
ncbi:MAG: TonB-dependent receptor [Salibacteraceae bacterium]|nr:TonB-dependent receptor [Salibacteraceae bacterium]